MIKDTHPHIVVLKQAWDRLTAREREFVRYSSALLELPDQPPVYVDASGVEYVVWAHPTIAIDHVIRLAAMGKNLAIVRARVRRDVPRRTDAIGIDRALTEERLRAALSDLILAYDESTFTSWPDVVDSQGTQGVIRVFDSAGALREAGWTPDPRFPM